MDYSACPKEMQIKTSTSNQDTEHLRLLSIFHYVVAGVLGLFSLFPIIHLVIGIAIVGGAFDMKRGDGPPEFFGWMFIAISAVTILCGLAMAISIWFAGRRIKARQNYTYCFIVAGIECCFMPFGTVLGVLTIIVLMRPTVKEMFGAA